MKVIKTVTRMKPKKMCRQLHAPFAPLPGRKWRGKREREIGREGEREREGNSVPRVWAWEREGEKETLMT